MSRSGIPAAVATALALAAGSPAGAQTDLPIELVTVDQELGVRVPLDAEVLDERGARVRLESLLDDDRPSLLALVYYECPSLCNQILNGLLRSLRAVPLDAGEDFRVLAVGIDPEETPELAAAARDTFVGRYDRAGAADGFRFLVGADDGARRIADGVGYRYVYDAERDEYAHPSAIVVLTPEGRVSSYLFGIDYPPRDVRLALVDAAGGTIGSKADLILLRCFRYDPSSGRYTLAIMGILRVGGVVTVLVLAGSILAAVRRAGRGRDEARTT